MPIERDVILRRREQQNKKADEKPRYRAVLCASDGSRTTGSIWADENNKRVYFQFFGSGGVGRARCEKLVPELGLGVYVGKTDDNLEWQVLEDDPLLRQTATDNRNYQAVAAHDLQPGGRLFMWIYPKSITPLATYPDSTGLIVNVEGGDYPYLGARKTFVSTSTDLASNQPSSGEHRLVGLYIDSANTLQKVNGTAVAVASTPPEPPWPAGAFWLSTVRIANPQTSIVFASDNSDDNDISDRRMVWSDESSSGGWPFAHVLTVSSTDPDADYTTIAAAITAASAGDVIILDAEIFTEDLIITIAISIVGSSRTGTIINGATSVTSTIDITAHGVTFQNLTITNSSTGAATVACIKTNKNITLRDVTLTKTNLPTDAVSLYIYGSGGGINLYDVDISSSEYGILADTAASTTNIYGGKIQGSIAAIFSNHASVTINLFQHPIIISTITVTAGTINGWNSDSTGNLIAQNAIGISGGVWLYRTDGLRIKYSSLSNAIAAAAASDLIHLFPGTYSLTALETLVDIGLTIEGESPESTIITNSITNNAAFFVNAANITFRNCTIRHTGAGTVSGCFQVNANNFTLDNVVVEKTSGAPTTGYGVWIYAGTGHRIINGTKITCTSGTTTYGLQNSLATVSIGIEGGQIEGTTNDIKGDQAGSTITLGSPVLVNGSINFTGTIRGMALNASGDIILLSRIGNGVSLHDTTTQTFTNATHTAVTMNTENYDDDGFHSLVSNTSRITIPTGMGGRYLVVGSTIYDANATGIRQANIWKNGVGSGTLLKDNTVGALPGGLFVLVAEVVALAAGDYIELGAYQSSGGNLDGAAQSPYAPTFTATRLK